MKEFKPKAWLLPQPVLILGTYGPDGTPNAMNAAWGGQWDVDEIMISMGAHATTQNLNRCPDFTVAFATEKTLVAADYVGIESAKSNPGKINATGWSHSKAKTVDAPVFSDFPMSLECRIVKKLDESETGCYIIAQIMNIVCDENFIAEDGKPDVEKMGLITYDPVHNTYIALGKTVGKAFSAGRALKKKN